MPDVRLSNPGMDAQIFKAVTAAMAALMYMHITKFALTFPDFD